MKKLIFGALIVLSFTSNAYDENNPKFVELSESGRYTIEQLSPDCSAQYPDILVKPVSIGKNGLCVKPIRFSEEAYSEMEQMADEQYHNYSDYDARITDAFAFEHRGLLTLNGSISPHFIESLAKAFNFAEGSTNNFRVSPMNMSKDPLYHLPSYLFIGDVNAEVEMFNIGYELKNLLKEKQGLHLSLTKELELYPGGGVNVIYHFFLMDGKTVYVKEVYWDA